MEGRETYPKDKVRTPRPRKEHQIREYLTVVHSEKGMGEIPGKTGGKKGHVTDFRRPQPLPPQVRKEEKKKTRGEELYKQDTSFQSVRQR